MDPYSAGIGAVAGLINSGMNLYGANQERKMRRRAADMAEGGAKEMRGGKGYDPNKALEFLGLTDQSNYDSMDPQSKEYSMQALKNLIDRGSGTGLDIQSKQSLAEAIARTGGAQNAARQAVMQEYMQRGTGGSGAELAGALAGEQANYGQLAGATGAAAAAAEQRRLEANVLASRAGQQQQQLEQQRAAAKDALQRFNVGARQGTLDLERQYRSGASGALTKGAEIMGGLAKNVATPYAAAGRQVGRLGEVGAEWWKRMASGGGNQPSYGNYPSMGTPEYGNLESWGAQQGSGGGGDTQQPTWGQSDTETQEDPWG